MDEKLDSISWFQSEMISYGFGDRGLTLDRNGRFHGAPLHPVKCNTSRRQTRLWRDGVDRGRRWHLLRLADHRGSSNSRVGTKVRDELALRFHRTWWKPPDYLASFPSV